MAKSAGGGVGLAADVDLDVDTGGWGEDADIVVDEEGVIVDDEDFADAEEGETGGGWDVDDEDLDLPPDLEITVDVGGGEGFFVPPTKGEMIIIKCFYNSRCKILFLNCPYIFL